MVSLNEIVYYNNRYGFKNGLTRFGLDCAIVLGGFTNGYIYGTNPEYGQINTGGNVSIVAMAIRTLYTTNQELSDKRQELFDDTLRPTAEIISSFGCGYLIGSFVKTFSN